jgi:single-strand DNA-binding protein
MSIECCFVGRIGQEASELKQSKAGKPWASFTVAVGGEGEDKEDTQWIRVAVFGSKAEELAVAGSLTKGVRVYVEGRLRLDRWTAKDGTQQAGLSVAANVVQAMGQIGAKRPRKGKPTSQAHERSMATNEPLSF